jgi:hypothetical protein
MGMAAVISLDEKDVQALRGCRTAKLKLEAATRKSLQDIVPKSYEASRRTHAGGRTADDVSSEPTSRLTKCQISF